MAEKNEQRLRSRARLDLAVRIRQIGPPRDLVEIARTLDVSRNGLLFLTRQPYNLHSTVWVTVPYNPSAPVPEPEFPATVVRINRREDGSSEVALQFHSSRSDQSGPRGQRTPQAASSRPIERSGERRLRSRVRMALPIRVRFQESAEESVTLDVSRTGVLFRTVRSYPVGHTVWVAMPYQAGARPEEVPARVVRIVERKNHRGVALHFSGEAHARAL
jgi:hypothetical protein